MGHVTTRLCRERKIVSNQFRYVSDACQSTSLLDHLPIGLGISTAVTVHEIIHISE